MAMSFIRMIWCMLDRTKTVNIQVDPPTVILFYLFIYLVSSLSHQVSSRPHSRVSCQEKEEE